MKAQNLWRSFALLLAAALLLAGIPAVSAISQEGIKEYPAEGGNIYVDGNTVVDADETITKVEIPEENGEHEIIAIGHDAFAGCSGLETVVFPASVHLITYGSFAGCTSLKSLYFEGNRPYMEDEEEFRDAAEDLTHLLHRGNNRLGRAPGTNIHKNLGESAGSSVYALSCGERKYLYKYNHWICGGRRLNRYSR
ncbi:MAG: leucine-rich repeat protein [Oscillospiraceae bacterium]